MNDMFKWPGLGKRSRSNSDVHTAPAMNTLTAPLKRGSSTPVVLEVRACPSPPTPQDAALPHLPRPPTTTIALLNTLIRNKRTRAGQDQQLLQDRAVRYFNLSVSIGTRFFQQEFGDDADTFACFLKNTSGISKIKLGQAIAGSQPLRDAFLNTFDLQAFAPTCLGLELAFRHFLSYFKLPGEGQEIDRVLESFSTKFHFAHSLELTTTCLDTTHQFLFLMILLNVNLNNPVAAASLRPMSRKTFCECYQDIICHQRKGLAVTPEELGQMYDSIRQSPIVFIPDREQLAGNLFTRPDMSGWLTTSATFYQSFFRKRMAPQWMLGRTRFVILTQNSLYLFRKSEDVEFEFMIPLENLRLFVGAVRLQGEESTPSWQCGAKAAARTMGKRIHRNHLKLLLLPREPLRYIKIGQVTKRNGMCLEMVSSLTLTTRSSSEFDCWLAVLRRKGLGRSQTYSVLSPPAQTRSTASWSSLSTTPKYYGLAELREVMDNYPEDEEETHETVAIV
ncbi:hypothetical protein BASA81_001932 [Batrachochytrium salamandrivorans]|nr:hypothetical protein BASA81_001932 [Batrachochytrium salamandrivorans]